MYLPLIEMMLLCRVGEWTVLSKSLLIIISFFLNKQKNICIFNYKVCVILNAWRKKNIQKGVLKQKLGLTPNEIKLGCKFNLLNAQWCKRLRFWGFYSHAYFTDRDQSKNCVCCKQKRTWWIGTHSLENLHW